ncbi:YrhB domain-containing protein [Microbispora catharanthi]|uniref:Immunity protein 35 domain-containing protein n=1 Tax=Microbispora catharanthi TaxID=1712871 RepID=A0A5N6AX25_9ACTN|nr:YrhB domain-containing protein [Microbispora catharanthi]KAB8172349.1 hypothetical protein FH610_042420 [Microbispora catharanthi]
MDQVQAKQLAERFLFDEIQPEVGYPLTFCGEEESLRYWIFYYNTVQFCETGEIGFALAGNGPILVAKDDGVITTARTDIPLEGQL